MNKKYRYWVRLILVIIMAGLIGFAIYQAVSEESPPLEIGEEAPDFELKTLDGKKMKLSDLRGKGVLINFWASWCAPCRDEMPAIQEMYDKYQSHGFEVLAVNIAESEVTAGAFARQLDLTFPILMDRERDVVRLYRVGLIPSSFFVDPEGKIHSKFTGEINVAQLEPLVNAILPEKDRKD